MSLAEELLERVAIACEQIAAIQARNEKRYLARNPDVASAAELDGQYGNPVIRKDPKRWHGGSFEGATMSQCPTDYLTVYAEQAEWSAGMSEQRGETYGDDAKPVAPLRWRDARLARGWAKRNEGKELAPPKERGRRDASDSGGGGGGNPFDDNKDIPF